MTEMKSYRVVSANGSVVVQEFEARDDTSARDQVGRDHPEVALGTGAQLKWRKGDDWIEAGLGSGRVTGTGE
ncbi:hypothetical protein AYK61_01370 [Rhodococcus sp. SBT000017]|uniref:hypothetical protein n=1 Tax=unclassified Rhodococcus (in: high G+C Gram-positive bacteria) TaxID=192944 RepID=UPI000EF8A82F|nr:MULTISPECIES: hypothetical protein [unclassified Rhodococcus (in: high G+C Gram-positive bacteria)]RMB75447.1 hypothetical protein AYK61_01370 [Rhodococcus sp. SBT000017]